MSELFARVAISCNVFREASEENKRERKKRWLRSDEDQPDRRDIHVRDVDFDDGRVARVDCVSQGVGVMCPGTCGTQEISG